MEISTTSTSQIKAGFYERTIIGFFKNMTNGSLHIQMPSGEEIFIGDGLQPLRANLTIHNNNFFKRSVLYGDIGFGESYTDGDWDTDSITMLLKWFLINIENAPSVSGSKAKSFALNVLKLVNRFSHFGNANTINGSQKNIAAHYDLNNDFFSLFLDPTMTYSSGIFVDNSKSLEQAQEAKYERLCQQLHLSASDHVLEIGSGWGGNAIYMATNYNCQVTTLTISKEQHDFAVKRIAEKGLQHKIDVLLQDYRTMKGSFDKIVSVEMIEAVGHNYLQTYFNQCTNLLKPNGIFALQAITCPDSRYESLRKGVDWIQKHIFPGSLLPSVAAINKAINKAGELTLVDLKDFGLDYATTLALWRTQFNSNAPHIRELGFNDAFIRKWNYYFSYCEAAFAMRNINVMQMVYARPNVTQR